MLFINLNIRKTELHVKECRLTKSEKMDRMGPDSERISSEWRTVYENGWYVYTGTGNSLWIARQLALELKEVSLHFMPYLSTDFKVEADGVGIVFPVHIWGLPIRVIQFINHLQVKPETYFFALAVNAGQPAATLLQLQKLMSTRQLSLALGYSIVMPSNYTPWGGPGPMDAQ
jgi:hypothetical protein